MLDVFIHVIVYECILNEANDKLFLSFKSQTVKRFKRAKIKLLEMKRISIMCA